MFFVVKPGSDGEVFMVHVIADTCMVETDSDGTCFSFVSTLFELRNVYEEIGKLLAVREKG